MTDKQHFIDVDPTEDDFVTVVADGAYLHFQEGFVSMLFFQDKTFPSHNAKDGNMTKKRTKRGLLHEVRLSIFSANILKQQLSEGLGAYNEFGMFFENRDLWQTPLLEKTEEGIGGLNRPKEFDKMLWSSFAGMFRNSNKKGQEKMLEILGDCLHEHFEEIRAIATKHAKKKDKVFPYVDKR